MGFETDTDGMGYDEPAEGLYNAVPTSIPSNSSTGMYFEADPDAPPIPSKTGTLYQEDLGYMDLAPSGADA